ncbi:MAG: GGDEF domain-containing protein [Planctomycetota bacterium]|jgi:diguanylate cyclase (GGDEF)-like protein|nr:GGDEF domain-containing protein [Planctomycetota bacterium]
MTKNEQLALNLLQSFNFAVLRRVASREYVFLGRAPAFYDALFPPRDGNPCATPWAISSMLEFFLDEAEDFFALGEVGSISSGVWEEEGLTLENTALKVTAVNLGDAQVVVVRLLQEDYTERLGILRKAREQLLENRRLTSNLCIFKEKSRIDGLTCIFNRTTFMELLLDEIRRSQIMDYPLVLLILDIDDFKKVNDNFGHLAGDRILQGMGSTLKHSLRRNDIVARYGGEEFAVLVPHTPLAEATQVAEKIRSNLAAMAVPDAPRITVSIGCTLYAGMESAEDFFKRADDALYTAKKSGKNRVCTG